MDRKVMGKNVATRPLVHRELLVLKHGDDTLSGISPGFRLGNTVKGILQ